MRSRAVRVSLLLLAAVSVLAAAFLFWSIDRRTLRVATAASAVDTRIATAIRQTFDLRSAQQGYVSQGQSEKAWIPKVTAAAAAMRESLTGVQAVTTAASSRVALDGALQALHEFDQMDRRAREYLAENQKQLASDLIFSDGLDATDEIVTALEQARYMEAQDAAAALASGRREQLLFSSAAAAIALLVVVLLTPAPREERAEAPSPAAVEVEVEEFQFRPLSRSETAIAAAPAVPQDAVDEIPQAEPPKPPPPDLAPDIQTIAGVCQELARLADTTGLPALLARAATAMDASGVMLWVADPDGQELTAIAAHGYPPHILSRVGTIKKDTENVTAAAFRTGLLQTLRGDATAPAAIAAPLVNPSGCIGVMSAEVGHENGRQPARLALATIVAAQLATLVAPATRAHSKSEAV